jgi:hypothetical protein
VVHEGILIPSRPLQEPVIVQNLPVITITHPIIITAPAATVPITAPVVAVPAPKAEPEPSDIYACRSADYSAAAGGGAFDHCWNLKYTI